MQCVAYTVHGHVRYTGERGVVCDPDPEGGGLDGERVAQVQGGTGTASRGDR